MTDRSKTLTTKCDICERECPTIELQAVATKAHGTLQLCQRCDDWAVAHNYVK